MHNFIAKMRNYTSFTVHAVIFCTGTAHKNSISHHCLVGVALVSNMCEFSFHFDGFSQYTIVVYMSVVLYDGVFFCCSTTTAAAAASSSISSSSFACPLCFHFDGKIHLPFQSMHRKSVYVNEAESAHTVNAFCFLDTTHIFLQRARRSFHTHSFARYRNILYSSISSFLCMPQSALGSQIEITRKSFCAQRKSIAKNKCIK